MGERDAAARLQLSGVRIRQNITTTTTSLPRTSFRCDSPRRKVTAVCLSSYRVSHHSPIPLRFFAVIPRHAHSQVVKDTRRSHKTHLSRLSTTAIGAGAVAMCGRLRARTSVHIPFLLCSMAKQCVKGMQRERQRGKSHSPA
jgi:hypothetical protein